MCFSKNNYKRFYRLDETHFCVIECVIEKKCHISIITLIFKKYCQEYKTSKNHEIFILNRMIIIVILNLLFFCT